MSSPRRALTFAVAVVPVTVTSVTSSSKSSASPVSFSISPAQSLPDDFSLFASAVESTSRQIAEGLRFWALDWRSSIVFATALSAPLKSFAEVGACPQPARAAASASGSRRASVRMGPARG